MYGSGDEKFLLLTGKQAATLVSSGEARRPRSCATGREPPEPLGQRERAEGCGHATGTPGAPRNCGLRHWARRSSAYTGPATPRIPSHLRRCPGPPAHGTPRAYVAARRAPPRLRPCTIPPPRTPLTPNPPPRTPPSHELVSPYSLIRKC